MYPFQASGMSILAIILLALSTAATYILYLHPLSKVPGPRLWALSRIPFAKALCSGHFAVKMKELHSKYGPIVRIASNEVSLIDQETWNIVYGSRQRQGTPAFPKSPLWYQKRLNGSFGIMASPNSVHGRFRRTFSPAFTEKAVREQEPLITRHLDLLISQLSKETSKRAPVDILKWFECVTFDIIGDLCYSDSFRCLESDENHAQIEIVQSAMKTFTFAVIPRVLPHFEMVWKFVFPRLTLKKRLTYPKSLNEWTHKRLDEGDSPEKNDLMTYVHRRPDEKGLSLFETENALGDFMIAGSETVATTLGAIMYHLVKSPETSRRLISELQNAAKHESDITASVLSELPLLNAVINEAMRLCPSLPTAMPRIVPEPGATICGHWLPAGTLVSFSQLAAYTSPNNFSSPDEFIPSRWLPQESTMKTHNTEVYQPFSIGQRNCIGKSFGLMEVRLILAKLLWNFEFTKREEEWDWNDQKAFFLWEKRPLYVGIARRNNPGA